MAALESLIRDLNSPQNQRDPEKIDDIQKKIQRIQRDRSAWEAGLALLNHDEPQMRFYGALTITIKVKADWYVPVRLRKLSLNSSRDTDKIGEDRVVFNKLLESLVTHYIRLAAIGETPFVLTKLCTTLVAVFQRPDSAWALPVRHIFGSIVANRYLQQDEVPEMSTLLSSESSISGSSTRAILMLGQVLAEDTANLAKHSRA